MNVAGFLMIRLTINTDEKWCSVSGSKVQPSIFKFLNYFIIQYYFAAWKKGKVYWKRNPKEKTNCQNEKHKNSHKNHYHQTKKHREFLTKKEKNCRMYPLLKLNRSGFILSFLCLWIRATHSGKATTTWKYQSLPYWRQASKQIAHIPIRIDIIRIKESIKYILIFILLD